MLIGAIDVIILNLVPLHIHQLLQVPHLSERVVRGEWVLEWGIFCSGEDVFCGAGGGGRGGEVV